MGTETTGKSIVAKFIESASVQIVNFVVGLVLARLLSPDDYGVYSILLIFINIGQAIIQSGFGSALVQKKQTDSVDYSTAYVFSLGASVLVYVVLFAAAPIIAAIYKTEHLVAPLRVIAITLFPSALFCVVNARIAKTMDFGFQAKFSSACVILTGVIGIALAALGAGVWALVVQQILSFALFPAVYCVRKRWFPGWEFSWERLKALFGFGSRILLTDLVNAVYLNIQGLIIGIKYSTESLAFFNRGQIFPNTLMTTTNSTVSTVLFPVYAQIQDQREKMKDALLRSLNMISFVVYPMLLGMFAVADLMVDVLLTEKWAMCVSFVQIYCIAYLFWPLDSINLQVIKACGAGQLYLSINLLKKCISSAVLLIFVLFSRSVEIFALSVVVIYVFDVSIGIVAAKKLIPITAVSVIKAIWKNLLCACGVLTVMLIPKVFSINILNLAMRIAAGAAIYVIMSLVLNRQTVYTVLDVALRILRKKGA